MTRDEMKLLATFLGSDRLRDDDISDTGSSFTECVCVCVELEQ